MCRRSKSINLWLRLNMKSSIYSLSFKEGALYPDKAKNGTGAQIPPNFKYADTNTRTAFFFQGTNSLSVIIFGF